MRSEGAAIAATATALVALLAVVGGYACVLYERSLVLERHRMYVETGLRVLEGVVDLTQAARQRRRLAARA